MRFIGIDPSTKTGFVALDKDNNVLKQKELKGIGAIDPKRIVTLTDEIMAHIQPGDILCIEGVPFDTQRAAQAGWIHGSIRNSLFRKGYSYYEVAPNAVKKFVAVTGWVGEKGKKRRVTKQKEKKQLVADAVMSHFNYTHASDNIVDAYIMARIAKALWSAETGEGMEILTSYQAEVIHTILHPEDKPKPKKKKKVKA